MLVVLLELKHIPNEALKFFMQSFKTRKSEKDPRLELNAYIIRVTIIGTHFV